VSVGVFAWADSWLWPFWGRRKWGFGLVACQLGKSHSRACPSGPGAACPGYE